MNRIIPFIPVIVIVIAILFQFEFMNPTKLYIKSTLLKVGVGLWNSDQTANSKENSNTVKPIHVFTKDELARYKGYDGGRVYLAIVGNVYDVTRGKKHYGPGGGYEFFAGIDGSKAFITGEFDEQGLIDDISELKNSDVLGLENWKKFYEKDYEHVGVVEGMFYNKQGEELPMMHVYKNKLKAGYREKDLLESDRQLFPPCNSEWSQGSGGRFWCSTMSGGIKRNWEGLPRMYYKTGSDKPRCACIRTTGPPSADLNVKNHQDRGDLDNPNLKVYPDCDPNSNSCFIPEN